MLVRPHQTLDNLWASDFIAEPADEEAKAPATIQAKLLMFKRVSTMSLEVATRDAPSATWSAAWPPWVVAISVAIVFFLAAHLSLALLDKADGVAVFWPAGA